MKISIITINYNNLEGLKKTTDSILCQTFTDFEWIIIDGGSTDGSKEFIESIDYPLLSYRCSEKDSGVYNAQNKGITKAKGCYLLFLNSGDFLYNKDTLSNAVKEKFDSDFILGRLIIKNDNKETMWDIPEKQITAMQFFYGTLPHPATFIKKEMFQKFGLYDETMKICSDWKFFMDAILYGRASIKKIEATISVFVSGGISDTMLEVRKAEREQILSKRFPPLLQRDYELIRSINEIRKTKIGRFLYSCVYRLCDIFNKF